MGGWQRMSEKTRKRLTTNQWFTVSLAVLTAGLAYAFIVMNGDRTLWSGFTFIMILPILIGAILSLATPGEYKNQFKYFFAIQFSAFGALILIFAIWMREGVICILMIALPWLLFAMIGSFIIFVVRHRMRTGRFFSAPLLLLPLIGLQIEASYDPPVSNYTVTRQIEIAAASDEIWPLLLSVGDIQQDEGRWNFTQDIVGIPRPRSALLVGSGVGSVRFAQWGDDIRFEEHVTVWKPGHEIAWDFHFTDDSISRYTDRHISPDSSLLQIKSGGHSLEDIGDGRTRLTLSTHYQTQSWMHHYSSFWGNVYLGDIQKNILWTIKDRVESIS